MYAAYKKATPTFLQQRLAPVYKWYSH